MGFLALRGKLLERSCQDVSQYNVPQTQNRPSASSQRRTDGNPADREARDTRSDDNVTISFSIRVQTTIWTSPVANKCYRLARLFGLGCIVHCGSYAHGPKVHDLACFSVIYGVYWGCGHVVMLSKMPNLT